MLSAPKLSRAEAEASNAACRLAAVAARARVGASFYGGTQWSRWQVSAVPAVTGRAAG